MSALEVKHGKNFTRCGVKVTKSVIPIIDRGGFNGWINYVYDWVKDNSLNKTK